MAAPETEARNALIDLLETEFSSDGFAVQDDKLHESVGFDGTLLGVYPERSVAGPGNRFVNDMELKVQFFGAYDKQVDPFQAVSPSIIEDFAHRFKRALHDSSPDPNTGKVWFFVLDRIEFPDDPTGNKTRFVATLKARGNNPALLETTA